MAAPAIPIGQTVDRRASRGLWGDAARRLLRNKPAFVGLAFIALFVIAPGVAPILAPYGPLEGGLAQRLEPPSSAHVMGTDSQGRDECRRGLYCAPSRLGARVA